MPARQILARQIPAQTISPLPVARVFNPCEPRGRHFTAVHHAPAFGHAQAVCDANTRSKTRYRDPAHPERQIGRNFSTPSLLLPFAVISLTLALLTTAHAQTTPPPTYTDFRKSALAFNIRLSVDSYTKVGIKNPKWDDAVIDFIQQAQKEYLFNVDPAVTEKLESTGRLLYLKGCDDPLLEFLYGRLLDRSGDEVAAEHLLRLSADSMDRQHYPPTLTARAALDTYKILTRRGAIDDARGYLDVLDDALKRMLVSGDFQPQDRPLLLAHVHDNFEVNPADKMKQILDALKPVANVDPVALLMMEGQYHKAAAWQSRGGGFANTVTDNGWKGFEAELDLSRTAFTQAWQQDKTSPEICADMVTVGMGAGSLPEMRLWLARGISARFDDPNLYNAFIYGIYPRWLGNRETMLEFADECIAGGRYDTFAPARYIDILLDVRDECDQGNMSSWRTPDIYNKTHEVFEKLLADGGACAGNPQYRSLEAGFCLRAGHWDDARHALDQLKGEPGRDACQKMQLTVGDLVGAARAYSGPAAQPALHARDLFLDGKLDDAIKAYNLALDQQTDPNARDFLSGIVKVLQWQSDFDAGFRVELKADKDLTGFEPIFGRWTADTDGGLIATAASHTYSQLKCLCKTDFGDRWEMSADVDFLHRQIPWSVSGLLMATSSSTPAECFLIGGDPDSFITRQGLSEVRTTKPVKVSHHNRMTVRCEAGFVTVDLNGAQVYQSPPDAITPGHLRVGFGGFPIADGDVVRFRHVSIRKINP